MLVTKLLELLVTSPIYETNVSPYLATYVEILRGKMLLISYRPHVSETEEKTRWLKSASDTMNSVSREGLSSFLSMLVKCS